MPCTIADRHWEDPFNIRRVPSVKEVQHFHLNLLCVGAGASGLVGAGGCAAGGPQHGAGRAAQGAHPAVLSASTACEDFDGVDLLWQTPAAPRPPWHTAQLECPRKLCLPVLSPYRCVCQLKSLAIALFSGPPIESPRLLQLAFMTTTSDSFRQIQLWTQYHRALGVELFYLFVDGQVS
jgi:hypothetical protein